MPAFRRSARVLGMGLVALLATGCSAATATQNGSIPSQQAARGVSGTITSASTSTLQVQSAATGSAAIVTFTSSTTITDAVPGTLTDVKPGLCITARAASSAASSAASPVATPAAGTPLAAATVSLFEPTNGSCTGANGGGTRTANPSFAPSARPSPNPSSRTPGAGFPLAAVGTVTSVSGSTIVIATTGFAQGGQTPAPGTTTVTMTAQTVVTKREAGTAASLKTGRCVVALGATDAAGVTTATQIAVSDPVDGQCAMTGRGGFGGNRG